MVKQAKGNKKFRWVFQKIPVNELTRRVALCLISIVLFQPGLLRAQVEKPHSPPLKLSGEMGTFGEWYHGTNNVSRRPGTTGRLYFRPKLAMMNGKLNLRGDFLLSSEADKNRQDINHYGLSADWRWGKIQAGDFAPEFTPLTVSGITNRGGGMSLHPGLFFFKFFAGQSERGTFGATNERAIQGAQFGVEGRGYAASHFLVQIVRTEETAIRQNQGLDTLYFDPWASTTPQENLVASAHMLFQLPKRIGRIQGELAGSLHNQDKNAEAVDLSEIGVAVPGFLTNLFRPTISSSADYAYNMDGDFKLKIVNLQAGMYYIGSGFASLGVGSLLNDRKGYKGSISTHLLKKKLFLRMGMNRYSNNLIDQKPITTTRTMLNGSATYRVNVSTAALFNFVWSNAEGDSVTSNEFTYKGLYLSGGLMSRFFIKGRSWSWQLMASHQGLQSSVGQLQFIDNYSQSLNASLNGELTHALRIVPSLSFIFPQGSTASEKMLTNGGARVIYRLPAQKLRLSLGGSYGARGTSSNTAIQASVSWRFTRSDRLIFHFRHYFSRHSLIMKNSYNETASSLRYSKTF